MQLPTNPSFRGDSSIGLNARRDERKTSRSRSEGLRELGSLPRHCVHWTLSKHMWTCHQEYAEMGAGEDRKDSRAVVLNLPNTVTPSHKTVFITTS